MIALRFVLRKPLQPPIGRGMRGDAGNSVFFVNLLTGPHHALPQVCSEGCVLAEKEYCHMYGSGHDPSPWDVTVQCEGADYLKGM